LRYALVIARNSAFYYKGKRIKAQTIGKELGVKYILEGSVQRSRERVRIIAQLIDAKTGYHLWSEHFDRKIKDIFTLQDEITTKLITAMHLKLNMKYGGKRAQQYSKFLTTDVKAYDKGLRGLEHFYRYTKENNLQARQFFEDSVKLDNNFVLAHSLLGYIHILDFVHGWSKSPIQSFEQAEKCVRECLSMNEFIPSGHTLLSVIYAFKRQHQKAIEEGREQLLLTQMAQMNLQLLVRFIYGQISQKMPLDC
jgi:adenylate cyclase